MKIAIFTVRFIILLFSIVLTTLNMTVVQAESRRVALVIGNEAYQNAPLTTPVNDAYDMATVLHKVGFEVTLLTNINQSNMEEAMATFEKQLHRGVVGLFYYSGYAVQYEGENYLIPYDAMSTIQNASSFRYKAVNLGYMLSLMKTAKNDVNIVILDACQASPFSFSTEKGLAAVGEGENMIIAYATSPNKVCPSLISRKQRNSYYTKHLLNFITFPDLPIELMLKKVRTAVKKTTGNRQTPWYISSLGDTFKFNGFVPNTVQLQPQLKKAMLTVRPNVSNATLFINGKSYNFISPDGTEIKLPLGKYTIRVQKEGYFPFVKAFILKKDETVPAILHDTWVPTPW
jgi:hypothetical protein